MGKNEVYHYYVEGETEEKLLSVLKTEYRYIKPGKIEKLNVVQNKISKTRIRPLKRDTIVVLVFDTDSQNIDILKYNINLLKEECQNVKEIICITQVKNLEDELKRCCTIKEIKELTNSKSNKDFKRDLLKQSNIRKKLDNKNFDFSQLWICLANDAFAAFENNAKRIKIKK